MILKQLRTFLRGRIRLSTEKRRHQALQKNLERQINSRMTSLIRKFANTQAFLYEQFGIYEAGPAAQSLTEELYPVINSHYRRVFLAVFQLNNETYGRAQKQDDPIEEAVIFGRSIDLERLVAQYFATRRVILSGISNRMARQISRVIETGRLDNLTLPQIAKNITSTFATVSKSRAALIARTETHNAASFAHHAYHDEVRTSLGMKMYKTWVSTADARTRSEHSAANGQTVEMDEPFILSHPKLGKVEMQYPSDPAGGVYHSVNCRCVVVYADEKDVVID